MAGTWFKKKNYSFNDLIGPVCIKYKVLQFSRNLNGLYAIVP